MIVDTIVYALAKAVPGLMGLASVVVFLRIVDAGSYGTYALLSSIVGVWAAFSAGWFYQGMLRFGDEWLVDKAAFGSVVFRGSCVTAGIFCLFCGPHLIGSGQARSVSVLFFSLCLGVLIVAQTILLSALQTTLQPKRILVVELVRSIACFGGAAILVYITPDKVAGLLAGTALGYSMSFFGAAPSRRWLRAVCEKNRPAVVMHLRKAWIYGWPLSLWFAVQLLIPLIDRAMIANQYSLERTGRFSALSDVLTRCFSLAIFPITQAVYPRLARLTNDNKATEVWLLLKRAALFLVLAGGIVLPPIYFCRNLIVRFTLHFDGATYAGLVFPLALGGFVWQVALLAHKPLELGNRTLVMFWLMVLSVFLKTVGNIWALPRYGEMGAAFATLAAGLLYCGLCLMFSYFTQNKKKSFGLL